MMPKRKMCSGIEVVRHYYDNTAFLLQFRYELLWCTLYHVKFLFYK